MSPLYSLKIYKEKKRSNKVISKLKQIGNYGCKSWWKIDSGSWCPHAFVNGDIVMNWSLLVIVVHLVIVVNKVIVVKVPFNSWPICDRWFLKCCLKIK